LSFLPPIVAEERPWPMPFAICCTQLVKTYAGKPPVKAVRGIDLQVEEGECFGVLGPNGAGKTTTIEILEGLSTADSGEVEVLGLRWRDRADEIRQQIGISLQETRLPEKLTVLETLSLFRSFYGKGIRPSDAIARVSLEEKAGTWIKHLSGGQRQRLAVAAALVGDPRLLFLDEPTTGLDPRSRRQLWEIISQFRREGRTVLLTTHYMEEAERLCDRVAIVDAGTVIALGSPAELIAGLGSENVVEFSLESDEGRPQPPAEYWSDLSDVSSAMLDGGRYRLSLMQPHVVVPRLLNRLQHDGWRLASLTTRHASLEDVFVKLTGRHLDDEKANA